MRHIPQGDREALLTAAKSSLIDLGYAINEVDERRGLVTAHPAIPERYKELTGGGRLTSRRPFRRVVRVRVALGEDDVKVYCQVLVQRQTTETYRMFERERWASDVPGDTPIERDAATTAEQNTVWETVRRDTAAEQLIIQTMLENTAISPQ